MIIAKYKFNSTLYADLIPEFNAEFTNYVVTDETTETDSEGNVIKTRVIEHDTLLPTMMRFGILSNPGVRESALTEIISINTSNINDMTCMFYGCTNVTSINTSDWDTSKVTSMYSVFCLCTSLTSIDVSNFDTSNVTDMSYMLSMYSTTSKLTTIIGLDKLNTSNVKYMNCMFYLSTNLTSLDVSNFDTSNVTNMGWMFESCKSLTTLDVSNFDTKNVTDMAYMFNGCKNLTSLDVSKWDTSNVTNMNTMFTGCSSLTHLDLSNWNTSNVRDMGAMFSDCSKLTQLDVSNFNTSNVNTSHMFNNTPLLTNIGMLYCSQSTINTISSNISTPSTNVWVEGSMIDDLTSYDNVTYKAYYWEKEVLLNSPLLEGDKIVKKDGKIYHYHKMGMIVLDGSEDEEWMKYGNMYDDVIGFYLPLKLVNKDYIYISDAPIKQVNYDIAEGGVLSSNEELFTVTTKNIKIIINKSRLSTTDINGFKQWLQENPITVISELANPYYELISEDDNLSLPLVSEDNIISNNSLIPTNMNVKNNGMSTVAMNTSTKYTVAFDKDTDSSVTIDLCGSTIDTTDNVVEITTPSELANDEITFIGDCEVSNVRILEGSVSGNAIPKESFEGLKSSFEEGKIEGFSRSRLITGYISGATNENMGLGDYISGDNYNRVFIFDAVVGENITVTQPESTRINIASYAEYPRANTPSITCFIDVTTKNVEYTVPEGSKYVCVQLWRNNDEFNGIVVGTNNDNQLIDEAINTYTIKGDKSIGKYKVEYKVTGKNKATLQEEGAYYYYSSGCKMSSITHNGYIASVEPNKTYIVSFEESISRALISNLCFWDSSMYFIEGSAFNEGDGLTFTTSHNTKFITMAVSNQATAFQIEEGTVATEYEPYKSYTKTFYLNSPLLEGDTIEDVNGVATHVKRYGKVVLDGSEDEVLGASSLNPQTSHTTRFYFNFNANKVYPSARILTQNESPIILTDSVFSDNFGVSRATITGSNNDTVVHRLISLMHTNSELRFVLPSSELSVKDLSGFRQWLQQNPTTVVYELASPIYEPISTESILCDSYVNGHLDVDSNIPIEKVQFSRTPNISTKYLYPNTPYVLQFESDNIGKLNLSLANCYTEVDIIKGVNKISLPLADIPHNYLVLNGIGFNASNIQVVATERDNIRYFKGIQSSFEDKLVEDETNENYGKYEVKVTLEDENGVISNEFIYLNSPLLKGDKIEMYNGKLCHYHKMDKVVFDGSEDEGWVYHALESSNKYSYKTRCIDSKSKSETSVKCNNFVSGNPISAWYHSYNNIAILNTNYCHIYCDIKTLDEFKQWLSKNPTTVVYQLAEPYYEDITPIQNEFIITSIGESSFTIDSGAIPTDGEITYSVNVKLLNDLEESINNNTSSTDTDLSTILDDIINE